MKHSIKGRTIARENPQHYNWKRWRWKSGGGVGGGGIDVFFEAFGCVHNDFLRTDGRTDGRKDRTTYGDAWT